MVAGSIAEDVAMAVPAELLWKGAFSPDASTVQKAFAGMVDAVEFDGDGGPGSLVTMKFSPGSKLHYDSAPSKRRRYTPACRPRECPRISVYVQAPWARRRCSRAGWWRATTRRA
jgi:hypothetical protein